MTMMTLLLKKILRLKKMNRLPVETRTIFLNLFLFLFGSSVSSQSQSNNSSINTADRHIWIPADENELEQRRILQARFDEIEKDIESLFLRLDVLGSDEINMRGGIKKITPDIESMDKQYQE